MSWFTNTANQHNLKRSFSEKVKVSHSSWFSTFHKKLLEKSWQFAFTVFSFSRSQASAEYWSVRPNSLGDAYIAWAPQHTVTACLMSCHLCKMLVIVGKALHVIMLQKIPQNFSLVHSALGTVSQQLPRIISTINYQYNWNSSHNSSQLLRLVPCRSVPTFRDGLIVSNSSGPYFENW